MAVKRRSHLLIVSEDVESEALTMLIINKHRAGPKVCAVKAPGFGDNRRTNLEDLAILNGGEVISEDHRFSLDKVSIHMLGLAKKVCIITTRIGMCVFVAQNIFKTFMICWNKSLFLLMTL